MRFDAIGLFWEELDVVKPPPKEQAPKRTPPPRTWEAPDYLPEIEEARAFNVPLMSDNELVDEAITRSQMVFDVECYANYFLVCLRSLKCRKLVYFEMYEGCTPDLRKLAWILNNYCVIGFNSRKYDLPLVQLLLAGATCAQLKQASDLIILQDKPAWEVLKGWTLADIAFNHIDLIEVAPLMSSLKIYGGRLHTRRMWDLPFPPHAELSHDQMLVTRWYCLNDLDLTEDLETGLHDQLILREQLGAQYGMDLRSLSDAQIAETVIAHELKRLGVQPSRVAVAPGTVYRYQPPPFLAFESETLKRIFARICELDFVVQEDGYVKMPEEFEEALFEFGGATYQMGMGGLHSCETRQAIVTDGSFKLVDRDVASYYPMIILNCGIYPEHLGPAFLTVYQTLVTRRLEAKRAKNRVMADSLKITVNGTFGKLGSKWSMLYAPNLLFQVTITGQLSLLMLIEQLHAAGAEVVSANTDGIVTKLPTHAEPAANAAIAAWEGRTGFETEATEYRALYSRDVNNYIAIKPDGTTKNKGAYGNPWAEKYPSIFRMHKNPVATICIEAAQRYLIEGVPILQSIQDCEDVRKFVAVRRVTGGAVWNGSYLGKAIRWYYAKGNPPEMVYATSGNMVPKSVGAKPLMTLPEEVPEDLDDAWYAAEAWSILVDIGAKLV